MEGKYYLFLLKCSFLSCRAAISLCSWCTGNVHIGRTNHGEVGDVLFTSSNALGEGAKEKMKFYSLCSRGRKE